MSGTTRRAKYGDFLRIRVNDYELHVGRALVCGLGLYRFRERGSWVFRVGYLYLSGYPAHKCQCCEVYR